MHRTTVVTLCIVMMIGLSPNKATAQPMAKAQVANLITKVENGVDEFRNYLEKRGENASDAQSTAQSRRRAGRARPRSESERQQQEGRAGRCARQLEQIDE